MSEILRYRVGWAGTSGGAGVSTFHVQATDLSIITPTDVQNCGDNLRVFFENSSEFLPNEVSLSFPATQDVVESTTGLLVATVNASGTTASLTGALTSSWQNGVGTRVVWSTGQVVGGRRVKGYTYLVPYGNIMDTDGTLTAAATADIAANAAALLSAMAADALAMVVYREAAFATTQITAGSLTDKAVILRSRRD